MTTHGIAKILLERPDGNLTASVDVSENYDNPFVRAFGESYIGFQPDTNPDDTILLFEGRVNDFSDSRTLKIIKAVATIGVDFGYGKYEIDPEFINMARAICEQEGI